MTLYFHVTMAAITLLMATLSAVGMALSGISIEPAQLVPKGGVFLLILLCIAVCRWRKLDRLVPTLWIVFWMGLISDLHRLPMFLAGRQSVAFSDQLLADIDSTLGLEVTDVTAWVARYPALRLFLAWVYGTLVFLITAAIFATTLTNRLRAAKELVIACIIAILLTFPLFAVFQVHGPWVHYGYAPDVNQQAYMQTFAALKSESHYVMDLTYVHGLLTFPSFHTILAVLPAVALWQVPYLRWPGAAWAALIAVSTLTTGWHYVVDVWAGLVVCALAVAGARLFSRLEARHTRQDTPTVPALGVALTS